MAIIGWIIFGLIVGALARFLMPGPQPMGLLFTIGLGVAGSFVGGAIGNLVRGIPLTEPRPAGWIGATIGALLVLFIYGRMARRNV